MLAVRGLVYGDSNCGLYCVKGVLWRLVALLKEVAKV